MTSAGESTDAVQHAFAAARRSINEQLERLLAPLSDLAASVSVMVDPDRVGSLRDADLSELVPQIEERLMAAPAMVGFGFAAARGLMQGHDHHLLWYQKRPTGLRRLNLNLIDDDPELYDYFEMEWFTGAERRGTPAIFGPYVDYAGADFLVLTIAVPVFVRGHFVGVTGTDLDPDVVERDLVASMRGLPGDSVVVNADRSVLAAGTPRWMPGERLRNHPLSEPSDWLAVGALSEWTGWTFALAARDRD